jgi:hypothetical protein
MRSLARRVLPYVAVLVAATTVPSLSHPLRAISFATASVAGTDVKYLLVRLDRVRVQTALGQDRVDRTESLAGIARRHHALAAIDGGYFESFFPGPIKDLIESTVVNGHLVFKGDVGSTLFFDAANRARIEDIPLRIEGSLDGSYRFPDDWYADWLNRLPEGRQTPSVTIFTPAWGRTTGLPGLQAQIAGGVIARISRHSLRIPADGYVVYMPHAPDMAVQFRVGRRVAYRVVRADGAGLGIFANARQAIGGGPTLVEAGRIALDPRAEGFHDPALFRRVRRSIVGITRDGRKLILATAVGTLHQMARAMRALGAYEAMNLDGGASSGLWAWGHYLTTPERPIGNALLVLPLPDRPHARLILASDKRHVAPR